MALATSEMHNVLLVTIDSLRPDFLGCYSDWARAEQLSPRLDAWAEQACLFRTSISQGPRTPESFPAILSGQYASRYLDIYSGLSEKRRLISEILKEHGYACAAFNSNPYISRRKGYGRGFDLYEDSVPLGPPRGLKGKVFINLLKLRNLFCEPYTPAPNINHQVFSWLKGRSGPLFLWVHYMDVHGPYIPKRGFRYYQRVKAGCLWRKATHAPEQVTPEEGQRLRAAYKEEIRYTDRFLMELIESFDPAKTLVIITADHGELFGEHGLYAHAFKLYDTLLRVPLLIRLPGQQQGRRIPEMVRSLDIVPTVLDTLGLGSGSDLDGRSLRPLMGVEKSPWVRQPAISEIWSKHLSVRTEDWKLIANYAEGWQELFDLAADPAESNNLIAVRPEVAAELEKVIRQHLLNMNAPEEDLRQCGIDATTDAATESRLRALGYM